MLQPGSCHLISTLLQDLESAILLSFLLLFVCLFSQLDIFRKKCSCSPLLWRFRAGLAFCQQFLHRAPESGLPCPVEITFEITITWELKKEGVINCYSLPRWNEWFFTLCQWSLECQPLLPWPCKLQVWTVEQRQTLKPGQKCLQSGEYFFMSVLKITIATLLWLFIKSHTFFRPACVIFCNR